MISPVFPLCTVMFISRLDVKDHSLSIVDDMIDPGAAASVLLTSNHPKPKGVCNLFLTVDEVV